VTPGAATAVANDRIRDHAERRVVPANANNWACAAAQQFHHASLLDAGVRILEYPAMLHAKGSSATARAPRGNVQPRGLEPEALLRDRFPAAVRGGGYAVRRALLPAGRGSLDSGSTTQGVTERVRAAVFAGLSPLL
jgi:hypothetical protein